MKVKDYFAEELAAGNDPGPDYEHQRELAQALLSFQATLPELDHFIRVVQQVLEGWLAPCAVSAVPAALLPSLGAMQEEANRAAELLGSKNIALFPSPAAVGQVTATASRFDPNDWKDVDF